VLVLDEPTNHLDIPSREALEDALDAYQGTILTISHDRYFLDRVATQILALDGAGNAEHYDGDYTGYHDWKAGGTGASQREHSAVLIDDRYISTDTIGAEKALIPASSKRSGFDTKTKKNKQAKLAEPRVKVIKKARSPEVIEIEIADIESRLSSLSEEMAKPEVARDISQLVRVNDAYREAEQRLAELLEEWERSATAAG
jgi:ATP-binding cassette subfamily F protein 3